MAYCFITIPSMIDILQRLKLYLLSGQVALANQAIGQADGFFKTAVHLIAEVPSTIEVEHKMKSSEPYLKEFVYNLLSTLIIVPDHPEHGTLYLFRGLLNVVQDYKWEDSSDARARIYLNAITALSASCQEVFIYQIDKVDSNDKLYGGDKKFVKEAVNIIGTLLKQVFEDLGGFEGKNPRLHGQLILSFINRLIINANMSSPQMVKLVEKLWRIAQQNPNVDKKLMDRIVRHLSEKGKTTTTFQELQKSLTSYSKR